jgi:aspartate kinase
VGIVVQKYGGSSVADATGIKRVAQRIVNTRKAGHDVVVVVSAMGDTTDELRDLAEQVTPLPPPRELDMLLTAGERISMALLAMAIAQLGHKAQSFTGSQAGVITDSAHGKAKIIDITPGRIENAISSGHIAIVAGFQGVSQDTKDITTLGRGASDTTAVALAAALGAEVCEIYSDVDGVFSADPRIVPTARKLARVSTEEMLEMAASGAKVLMLRAVELARGHGVRIHARSTFSDEPGTWVQETDRDDDRAVRAVTHSLDDVLFTVRGLGEGKRSSAAVLRAVASEHVNVDTIVLSAEKESVELAFSVAADDVLATRRALAQDEQLGPIDAREDADLGKVSVVGAGIRSHTGIAARTFRALAEHGVGLRMISTSPIKISCLVDRADVERGVRALHEEFSLSGDVAEPPGAG